jgi:D-lyxose ketol-isomerase
VKRSEINRRIREAEEFFKACQFRLPLFAGWTPEQWRAAGSEADEIRERRLGWDLTDFGSNDFDRTGLLLVTIRNGDPADPRSKSYCEKVMIVGEKQVTPWHFHWQKTEDIINRGGGELVIDLARATEDESGLSEADVEVVCDGVRRTVPARGRVVLSPGESITLTPYLYHTFKGEAGKGAVLVGEVSAVNDDAADNRFLEPIGRFPEIEEDEPPYRFLCNEYPAGPG